MSATVKGALTWSASRDEEGQRSYVVTWHVVATNKLDGPVIVSGATGLSVIGASWPPASLDSVGERDAFALCLPTITMKQVVKNEPNYHWHVTQTFSTKPIDRCQTDSVENPLAEPDKISGGFAKYTIEATRDKDGDTIAMSNHERIRGSEVEFDNNRPTVRIERNIAQLGLATFAPLVDNVNDDTMWGLAARKVKLSNVTWEKRYYGTCTAYYNIVYEFDINYQTFDRSVKDMGFDVLQPGGALNNPADFDIYKKQPSDEPAPVPIKLNGAGAIAAAGADAADIPVEYYQEADLLEALDLPTTL